ncbi:unnamed protein product [Prorocentrum cordatum]|uniref:Uncharacterized protein n=1 Tax=Prorocentrum cordatum TaxID=2364126 RepID=A0ABN9UKX2_9DINO|nr:unnamed protein product [Polarella glacialis]
MTPCGCCKLSTQRSSWTLHRFTYSVLGRKTAGESRRYKLKPPADHHGTKTSIDKVVLAVEVPAGIIDGALCALWLKAILDNAWYRLPTQLTVSALHAFGTVIFWADELVPGYMNWFKGKGWKWTHTDGPKSIHWWWAFVGSNAVWGRGARVVVRRPAPRGGPGADAVLQERARRHEACADEGLRAATLAPQGRLWAAAGRCGLRRHRLCRLRLSPSSPSPPLSSRPLPLSPSPASTLASPPVAVVFAVAALRKVRSGNRSHPPILGLRWGRTLFASKF